MHAVIYPAQQSWSRNIQTPERQESSIIDSSQKGQTTTMESGLAQLSRMIEEQKASAQEITYDNMPPVPAAAPSLSIEETNTAWQMAPPADSVAPIAPSSASVLPLRASPIQDMPPGRDDYLYSNSMRSASLDTRDRTEAARSENSPFSGSLLAPPATPLSVLTSMMETAAIPAPVSPTPSIIEQEVSSPDATLETTMSKGNGNGRAGEHRTDEAMKLPPVDTREESPNGQGPHSGVQAVLRPQAQQAPAATPSAPKAAAPSTEPTPQQATTMPEGEADSSSTGDTTLLDIMKSLPPMSSPSPQQSSVQASVLSGRATRSLGSVLLEGHLVPQDRLEVAENIQRMLHGVDMNYQLGEILLMFKLLTPDQLLAASLVSYGLLTTAQIRALGRIRQELHSIGLEYDLENLLILFRILSSEQLREVRASWSA